MIGTKRYPFPETFAEAAALPQNDRKSLFGRQCIKAWNGLWQMEAFLRCVKPKIVIEFGCGEGMHTLYMGLWATLNDAAVYAYDLSNEAIPAAEIAAGCRLNCYFNLACDVLSVDPLPMYPFASRKKPKLLYCDINVGEVQKHAPKLIAGDYCVLHSWEHVYRHEDVESLIRDGILEYWMPEAWKSSGENMGFRRR